MLHLRPRHIRGPAGLLLLFAVTGCAGLNDPFEREGTWRPEYVNDANLSAMVADPRHIALGVGDPESSGELSAAAIRRLLTDHVKPLPHSDVGPVASGQAPSVGTGGGQ